MLAMKELSQLLHFGSPLKTLALGLLVACSLGLKAHPGMLSAISLPAESMIINFLTLSAVSIRGKVEADNAIYPAASGRGVVNEVGIGASLTHPSVTVPLDAPSSQSIEKCIYATEIENVSASGTSIAVSNPTLYLRLRCQPSRPSVKPNYENSTLFCLKELEGASESSLHLDGHCDIGASLLFPISSPKEYRLIDDDSAKDDPSGSSWPCIATVTSVIAFGLVASLLGYAFGISFLSWMMTAILDIASQIRFFVKLVFEVASGPLFFIVLELLMVYETCKSILRFGSILTRKFYPGSGNAQAAVILGARLVSDMLFFGIDLVIYAILLCVHGFSVIISAAKRPICLGIKLAFPRYSNVDILDYTITIGHRTIWPALNDSRIFRLVLYLLDIICTFSAYIQAVFDIGTQFAVSSFLFGVDIIFYNCLLLIEGLGRPFYTSGQPPVSRAKGIRLGMSDIALIVENVFLSLFFFFMLPVYIQEKAELYLETVIHFVFSILLNGLLNVLVYLFLFFDDIAYAYHNPGPSSPRWTCRDRRIIERFREKGIIFTGTTPIARRPSTPFFPKQHVGFYEDGDALKNVHKYHAVDYKFVAKIKRTGVDNISII